MLRSRGPGPADCQRVKDGAGEREGATRCGVVLMGTTGATNRQDLSFANLRVLPWPGLEGASRRVSSRVRGGEHRQGGPTRRDCAEGRSPDPGRPPRAGDSRRAGSLPCSLLRSGPPGRESLGLEPKLGARGQEWGA